jgi:hypothetical protein
MQKLSRLTTGNNEQIGLEPVVADRRRRSNCGLFSQKSQEGKPKKKKPSDLRPDDTGRARVLVLVLLVWSLRFSVESRATVFLDEMEQI